MKVKYVGRNKKSNRKNNNKKRKQSRKRNMYLTRNKCKGKKKNSNKDSNTTNSKQIKDLNRIYINNPSITLSKRKRSLKLFPTSKTNNNCKYLIMIKRITRISSITETSRPFKSQLLLKKFKDPSLSSPNSTRT